MNYTSKAVYEKISQETNDPIVEWKVCEVSGAEFPITQADLYFYDKMSPTFGGEKFAIPTPRLCPEERQRRRLLFRNERKLYRKVCDTTGESIISIYSPDKDLRVSSQVFWRSDEREMLGDGELTGSTIHDVFRNLNSTVLKLALISDQGKGSEGCQYCQDISTSLRCYLCSGSIDLQDSFYTSNSEESSYLIDCITVLRSSHCYECVDSTGLYSCMFCINCHECSNCYGCVGLTNKQYCINNIQYSKEEYLVSQKERNSLASIVTNNILQSESSYGNNIFGSSDCIFCYDFQDGKDSKFVTISYKPIDVFDCDIVASPNKQYDSLTCDYSTNVLFSLYCNRSSAMLYSNECYTCKDCFGCFGLIGKQYCIFNIQYSKEEYEVTVPKIIKQMQAEGTRGEFFDPSLSPFGYNETVAQEYYPLLRKEALERGYTRQDKNYDPVVPAGIEVLQGDQIPMDPNSVDSLILKKIFVCEVSGRPYRIIKQELAFYQKHNLSLPRKHPDIRHQERIDKRPGRTLYLRSCCKTGEEMLSVYPAEYEGKVYSEQAYQQEIYG